MKKGISVIAVLLIVFLCSCGKSYSSEENEQNERVDLYDCSFLPTEIQDFYRDFGIDYGGEISRVCHYDTDGKLTKVNYYAYNLDYDDIDADTYEETMYKRNASIEYTGTTTLSYNNDGKLVLAVWQSCYDNLPSIVLTSTEYNLEGQVVKETQNDYYEPTSRINTFEEVETEIENATTYEFYFKYDIDGRQIETTRVTKDWATRREYVYLNGNLVKYVEYYINEPSDNLTFTNNDIVEIAEFKYDGDALIGERYSSTDLTSIEEYKYNKDGYLLEEYTKYKEIEFRYKYTYSNNILTDIESSYSENGVILSHSIEKATEEQKESVYNRRLIDMEISESEDDDLENSNIWNNTYIANTEYYDNGSPKVIVRCWDY